MFVSLKVIADCCGIKEQQAREHLKNGLFVRSSKGKYSLESNVCAYIKKKLDDAKGTDHKAVKLEQDILKNKLMQLQIDEEEVRLVDVNVWGAQAADAGRKTRDAMLNLIPRLTPVLASKSDPHEIQVILNTEIKKALSELQKYIPDEDI